MKTNDLLIRRMYQGILITSIISVVSGFGCNIIDSIVTGQFLGPLAVAATGMAQPVLMVINLVGALIGSVGIVCTRYVGKAQPQKANQVFSIGCVAALTVTAAMTILLLLLSPALGQTLGASAAGEGFPEMIRDYLRGCCIGLIPMRFCGLLTGIMMLDNDKRRSMIAMGIILFTDIAFDLANVLIFRGGVFGMAVATSLSNVAGFLFIMTHFLKKDRIIRFTLHGLRLGDMKDVILCGIPSAISMGSKTIKSFVFNALLMAIAGSGAVAALSVGNSAFTVFNSVIIGIGASSSVLSGMLYGEEDRSGLGMGLKLSLRATAMIYGLISLLALLFPWPVAGFFIRASAEDVLMQGARFVRVMALQNLLMMVSFPISGLYQGTKNIRLNYLIDTARECVLPILCVCALGKLFGLPGVEAGFVVSGALVPVLCLLIPWIRNRAFPRRMEDLLLLPKDFGTKDDELYEASMKNVEEVIHASEEIAKFCRQKGADRRTALMLPLFVEEMGTNTVLHGFRNVKKGSIDLRIIYREGVRTIRLRDNGRPFDPVEWQAKNHPDDPASGVGIRVVTGLARDVQYLSAMELNSLIIQL